MIDTQATSLKLWLRIGLAVVLIAGMLPLTAAENLSAAENKADTAEQPSAEAAAEQPVYTPLTTFNGMRVYVDEQGRLRPPTEAERMERQRNVLTAIDQTAIHQQVPKKSADGTMSYILDTSYLHASVAHVAADGTLSWDCVQGAEEHLHGAHQVAPEATALVEEK